MSEREFRVTTPRFFYFRQKGFESLQNEYWQRSRLQAFYSFLPHTKKNSMKRPSDLFKLPGDILNVEYSEAEKSAMLEHLRKGKMIDVFSGETIQAEA